MFSWQKGRQDSGYEKLKLISNPWILPFDLYLLRFPEGSEVPYHTDPISDGAHYRCNLYLKKADKGGEFLCDRTIFSSRILTIFRPDVYMHAVTKVESGCRYVLSFGFVLK